MKQKNRMKRLCARLARIGLITLLFVALDGCKKTGEQAISGVESPVDETDEAFSIAVIPDTQYYTSFKHNSVMSMFERQIQWIRENKAKEKIAYVIHLGDLVESGSENNDLEWQKAKTTMYKLGQGNIPYGIAVGNHDQSPNGNTVFTNTKQTLSVRTFAPRPGSAVIRETDGDSEFTKRMINEV